MEQSADAIWSLDENLRIVFYNQKAYNFFKNHYHVEIKNDDSFIELLSTQRSDFSGQWLTNSALVFKDHKALSFDLAKADNTGFLHLNCSIYPLMLNSKVGGVNCRIIDDSKVFLRNKLQQALIRFESSVLNVNKIDDLLWCIADEVLAHLFLEDALILMREDNMLESKAAFGSRKKGPKSLKGQLKIEIGKGIVGSVALSGEAEIVNDTNLDKRYFKEHFDAGSEIAVPIVLQDVIIGVINCESQYKNFFGPIHLEILAQVAEVTARRFGQIVTDKKYKRIQEYNKLVLDSTPNSYILFNAQKRIISLNKQGLERLSSFGTRPVGIGSDYTDFVPKELMEDFVKAFYKAMGGKTNVGIEKIIHPVKGEQWIKMSFAPAKNTNETIFGVTMVIENVTKERLAENLVREKNENLEKANEKLDKFIYTVSHDLRSPIASVMGLTTLIDLEMDMDEIKTYNSLIVESMARMDVFIKDNLNFTRSNKFAPLNEEVNLESLLQQVVKDHNYMHYVDKIEFRYDLQVKVLLTDGKSLSVVLSNLISNAIKYHDSAKPKSFIELTSEIQKNKVLIIVKDNGLGIEDKHISKLFDMFYTANSNDKGTGVGLYILKETLVKLDGDISVESKINEGTVFTIYLPLKENK